MTRPKLTHMPHLEARRQAETEARAIKRGEPIVEACSICGSFPAPYGYGVYSDGRPGARFACTDQDCRSRARAMTENTEKAA